MQITQSRGLALAFAHGVSQIFFQTNAIACVFIVAAFAVVDWRMAVLVILGCAASTFAARALGSPTAEVRSGVQGLCGALVGAATFLIVGGQWAAYPIALVGGALCAPVTRGVAWLFERRMLSPVRLPPTTAPFCIVATAVFVGATLANIVPPHAMVSSSGFGTSAWAAFFASILTNVSQVVFVDNAISGALILIGLFVGGWRVGLAALCGSIVGSLVAVLGTAVAHLDLQQVGHGLVGYSGVLTAIALSSIFLHSGWRSWLFALLGAAVTGVMTVALQQLPGPIFTWPYILTTWVALVIAFFMPRLRRV
ncbi:MAG: urea transporter [Microbacteriaceae bacterium]